MAEPRGDLHNVGAVGDQGAGVRVAQLVERRRPTHQAGAVEGARQAALSDVALERRARLDAIYGADGSILAASGVNEAQQATVTPTVEVVDLQARRSVAQ